MQQFFRGLLAVVAACVSTSRGVPHVELRTAVPKATRAMAEAVMDRAGVALDDIISFRKFSAALASDPDFLPCVQRAACPRVRPRHPPRRRRIIQVVTLLERLIDGDSPLTPLPPTPLPVEAASPAPEKDEFADEVDEQDAEEDDGVEEDAPESAAETSARELEVINSVTNRISLVVLRLLAQGLSRTTRSELVRSFAQHSAEGVLTWENAEAAITAVAPGVFASDESADSQFTAQIQRATLQNYFALSDEDHDGKVPLRDALSGFFLLCDHSARRVTAVLASVFMLVDSKSEGAIDMLQCHLLLASFMRLAAAVNLLTGGLRSTEIELLSASDVRKWQATIDGQARKGAVALFAQAKLMGRLALSEDQQPPRFRLPFIAFAALLAESPALVP